MEIRVLRYFLTVVREESIRNIQRVQYAGSPREYLSAYGASFRTKDTIGILQGFQTLQGDKVRFSGTEGYEYDGVGHFVSD